MVLRKQLLNLSLFVVVFLLFGIFTTANANPACSSDGDCSAGDHCFKLSGATTGECVANSGCYPLGCGGVTSDCAYGKRCEVNAILTRVNSCSTDTSCPLDPTPSGGSCTAADAGLCGGSETSDCGWGEICKKAPSNLYFCYPVASTICPTSGGSGTSCQQAGCGYGCDSGQICAYSSEKGNEGYFCTTDTANECSIGHECTAAGCGNGCSPGQECYYSSEKNKEGYYCRTDTSGTCSTSGCDSANGSCGAAPCGPGYRCVNYVCRVDSTCIKPTVDVPYTGPKIKSFSTIMSRVYNLLFPAAILFGAITIIKAGYTLMTSQGDPRKTKEGQEELTAAILGTAFVVLSAALLRIIIVQILGGSVGF